MRRFLKPVIAVAAAGAAALIVATAGQPFDGAPAAKTKTLECRTTTTNIVNVSKKAKTVALLPTIPKAQLPCDLLESIPAKLGNIVLPTPEIPTPELPSLPTVTLPTIVIPPIPAIGFPGYPTTSTTFGCEAFAASNQSAAC